MNKETDNIYRCHKSHNKPLYPLAKFHHALKYTQKALSSGQYNTDGLPEPLALASVLFGIEHHLIYLAQQRIDLS